MSVSAQFQQAARLSKRIEELCEAQDAVESHKAPRTYQVSVSVPYPAHNPSFYSTKANVLKGIRSEITRLQAELEELWADLKPR